MTKQLATEAQLAAQAISPDARLEVVVHDRSADTVLTSQDADEPVASMSVVKLLIALDVLQNTPGADANPTTIHDLEHMLSDSDDDTASRLWQSHGGGAIVTRMARTLALTGTAPPEDPGMWGEARTTPQDLVTVYRHIVERVSPEQRELILGALSRAPRFASDGFDQYFGIPDGLNRSPWAVKQGWGTSGTHAVMNSTGVVGDGARYVVVIMATAPEDSHASLPRAVTAAASTLANTLPP
jgi:hypothetical protein